MDVLQRKNTGIVQRVYSGLAGHFTLPTAARAIMQPPVKPAFRPTRAASEYAVERKTTAQRLETADAVRADKRRLSYASIDSNASKWRYSATSEKS